MGIPVMSLSGTVLFATARTLATEIGAADYVDLAAHWTIFPPTADFAQWPEEKIMDLVADMASDRSETPRSCYRMIVRNSLDLSFIGYINAWKVEGHHFTPQLGICLNPEWQGNGIGTEIYRGLIQFAFDKFKTETVLQANLNPSNTPSLKLHFKCGMQPFCFVKDGYTDGIVVEDEMSMRITRNHFERHGAYKTALLL